MPSPSSTQRTPRFEAPTPAESADYTYDMLVSLGKLAALHKQTKLARLIEAAAEEARAIVGTRPD